MKIFVDDGGRIERALQVACIYFLNTRFFCGMGKVYAYSVVQNNAPSAFMSDMPFVIAIVRLDEGVQMMTNIVGCDPALVHCEMPVTVVFEKLNDEITLPKFKPV